MQRVTFFAALGVAALVLAVAAYPAQTAPVRPRYFVVADLVRGHENPTGTVCVQTNVFKQGELLVWRVRVHDAATGREIGDDGRNVAEIQERGLTVTAYLENGVSVPLRYDKHPPRPKEGEPVRWFWAGSWKIPDDYPPGTLLWWVIVRDNAGAFVRFDPIGAGTNLPAARVIIEKRG